MDNNITLPCGVWIKIEEFNNNVYAINMKQFTPDILENKDNLITIGPPLIKNVRSIKNNYADIKTITENILNNKC